jgi:MFS transporter, DHA1 family, multidrug resistance protein
VNVTVTKQQVSLVKLVLVLGALTAFNSMSIDMYLPAFPQIARDLAVPLGTVQLSVSAFLFGSAFGQLFYGPVADRWGRKLPLLFGLGLYVISTIGCALVRSGEGLLFWRVVMALGVVPASSSPGLLFGICMILPKRLGCFPFSCW